MQNQPQNFEESSIILERTINETIRTSTNKIIDFMLELDSNSKIHEHLVAEIIVELTNASFMTINLELTEEQKEHLRKSSTDVVKRAYAKYKASIVKTKREESHIKQLEHSLKEIIETSITTVGEEINRGTVVPSTVAKCNIANPDKKIIELHYAGDTRITVPTKGFFVSSNCVQTLQDGVEYVQKEKLNTNEQQIPQNIANSNIEQVTFQTEDQAITMNSEQAKQIINY